jgi:hypothetical protein
VRGAFGSPGRPQAPCARIEDAPPDDEPHLFTMRKGCAKREKKVNCAAYSNLYWVVVRLMPRMWD